MLHITRQYINAAISRRDKARPLNRGGISRLEDIIPEAEGETLLPEKSFKDYELGFVHIEIKYLPHGQDEISLLYCLENSAAPRAGCFCTAT